MTRRQSLITEIVEIEWRACLKKIAESIPIGHSLGYNGTNDSEVMPDAAASV
jgi:hypothetical protein